MKTQVYVVAVAVDDKDTELLEKQVPHAIATRFSGTAIRGVMVYKNEDLDNPVAEHFRTKGKAHG